MIHLDNFDVIVIGAGHAGIEAGLASARLGLRTGLFTLVLDAVANLPCNPSIGGSGKGHLVREIDALGGEMGRAADAAMIQSRMLGLGKGPAVHSLRAQVDRVRYKAEMKRRIENQDNLFLRQAEITDILFEDGRVAGVATSRGTGYGARAVVIATGTFLGALIHVGDYHQRQGPDGLPPADALAENLKAKGLSMRRFKTGTPARVHRRSINFAALERQPGDEPVIPFSFDNFESTLQNRIDCHIAYTNARTHAVIRADLHRSPMYSGVIEGIGARYCPSIEDKVVRFADKPRHQIFVEPCGIGTDETYLQGASSSLPEDVQIAFYRTIEGFEELEIMRPAYAIEYDCIDTRELTPSLMLRRFPGLFGAGQFCGSSGYEEAAAQGLVAGVNAARYVRGQEAAVLPRRGSYIGTLIDDLCTKEILDPYRIMTSRSEVRLFLRQDNAHTRLTPTGRAWGLVDDARWAKFCDYETKKDAEIARLQKTILPPGDALNTLLAAQGTAPLLSGANAAELLRRPQLHYRDLLAFMPDAPRLPALLVDEIEIELKYAGYVARQLRDAAELDRLEGRRIPERFDYGAIRGLRLEAVEKLERFCPQSVGQASRIAGVSPADVSVLLIALRGSSGDGCADRQKPVSGE